MKIGNSKAPAAPTHHPAPPAAACWVFGKHQGHIDGVSRPPPIFTKFNFQGFKF